MFIDNAIDLVEKHGCSVIPLGGDDGKKPLIKTWTEFQTRQPSEAELEEWNTRWPDANIGIITGAVSGLVVIDADGDEGLAWMKEHLPVTSVYVKTGKGWHAYFKHPGKHINNKVRMAPQIDIRADGGYVVAPPSVHKVTGSKYEWVFTPGLGDWNGMPEFPADITGSSETGIGIDLTAIKPLISTAPVEKGQRNNTLAQLVGKWITANKLDPDEIWLMAQAWNSQLADPLPLAELQKTVESVLKTDARNHPEHAEPQAVIIETEVPPAQTPELPEEFLHPDGYLEMVMDYIRQSSAVYHPVFGLASALPLLGTLIGQKYQTETGLRTNLYSIALGYSGAGKNAPNNALPAILQTSHAASCWAGNDFTSEAALLKYLANENNARALAIFDEMGLILGALKNPNSPAHTLPASMMRLFSGTTHGYSKRYADIQNAVDIKWHHFSFVGFSTPVRFWDSMTVENAKDGFIARCLVFDSRVNGAENPGEVDATIPDALMAATNYFADIQPAIQSFGNLTNIPHPKTIGKTKEAAAYFKDFKNEYTELRDKFQEVDEARASIYNRAAEHAHKVALIHAASLHMGNLDQRLVGIDSVRYACGLVRFLVDNVITQLAENISENEFHRLELRAMQVIRKYCARNTKSHTCPYWHLPQHLKGATPRMINEVIEKLKSVGSIVEITGMRGGKPQIQYAIAHIDEGEE